VLGAGAFEPGAIKIKAARINMVVGHSPS
jgi:hypothetical protein